MTNKQLGPLTREETDRAWHIGKGNKYNDTERREAAAAARFHAQYLRDDEPSEVGDEIEVSLPGEPPFRARVWKDTNPYTLWYERADGTIDFAGREYIRVIAETK